MASAPKVSVVVAANVDKATNGLKKVNATIARLSAPMRKVNRSFAKMKRESGVQKLQKAFKSAAKDARRAASAVGGIVKKLAMVGGAAAAAGVAIVKTFSSAGDLLAKNAAATGWSIKGMQEYSYIAQRQGATQEEVNSSLLAFSKRMGEAKAGTGALRMFLEKTNPALLQQMQAASSNEEAFKLYVDAMRQAKDPAKQAAMASAAFSRQGIKLAGIAKASADAVEQMRQRAHALGLVMSNEDAKAAEEFADASLNLDYAMQGLRNRIGAALAPMLSRLSNQLADLAAKYGPAVRQWAESFAENLPQRIAQLRKGFSELKSSLQPMISLGQWISENFGLARAAMYALAAIITGKLIIGVVALSGAIKTLGIALMTTPIGWITAAIAALVAVGVLLYKNWDMIKQKAADVWGAVTGFAAEAWSVFKSFNAFILSINPFYLLAKGANALVKALTGFDVLTALQNKLQNLLPDWALKLLGFNKVAATQQAVTAPAPLPGMASTQVGGTLKIHIDSEGRPKVKELTSTNRKVPVQVDAGMIMAGAI
ncbi:hypothetical protein [Endozoicomonas acroporae]|uniref:hypothetical protein n=1 Tax=Endozoicomonas acroporae TaxID=1701104 RepID=UPI0013D071BC|nr:hypothetical protein [Endozoicomonas acroporae]